MGKPEEPTSTALVVTKPSVALVREPPKGHKRRLHVKAARKDWTTRKKFLHFFEETFGNVAASCKLAGIGRMTYYRWINSPTKINEKFRKQLERILAPERALDLAESVVIAHAEAGSLKAAQYYLDNKGKARGYGDKTGQAVSILNLQQNRQQPERPLIEKVADACLAAMEKYADQIRTENDRWSVVQQFAKARKVDAGQLAERVGLIIDVEATETQNVEGVQ